MAQHTYYELRRRDYRGNDNKTKTAFELLVSRITRDIKFKMGYFTAKKRKTTTFSRSRRITIAQSTGRCQCQWHFH